MTRLAGTTWGCGADTLRTTALALVYSVAEYCAPVWERSSHTDSIDAQLNQTMRLITGNMRPTPIDWLPYLSNIAPPDLRRKKSTSNLLSKIKANTKLPINTVLEIPPPTRLISRNPAWVADENVDLKEEWRNRWSNLAIANKDLVEDPNTKPPGYNLPRRTWSTLNRIRTSTGRCNYLLNKWNMSPDQNCDCGQIQTMHHILRDCPRRFFQGTLGDIHRCTEEALETKERSHRAETPQRTPPPYLTMASIKAFFKKKRLDAKFKTSGPGHKLSDTNTPSSSSAAPSEPGPSQSRPPPPPTAHLEAALSRLNTAKSKNVDWSVAHIKAQAKKEMEEQKGQQQEGNGHSKEVPPRPSTTKKKSGNPPMVQGVYFNCELLGPETGSYEQILNNIQDYLYSQLPEEPVLTSILIMYSCNEMSRMRTGVETLIRYLNNIIEHPGEEKYRKIRLQNKAFQERVASLTGSMEFLEAVGFVRTELPTPEGQEESYLVFLSDTEDPDKLKEYIESLNSGEAIVPRLDRNLQVLAPAVAASHMELPDDFFNLTLDELRREQALK
ncbi:hypothetical protein LAZ67_3004010 [Cordylochernes scorpioides]|uniref:PUB domain-containing protein n=1 Tax=Cordylochernes scorpioides TaxID=51811 RepID=A0ABY6K957_9ARAC|nr:hypothetical protein LAZ67_3004010 [Cordylochernes scorpioides]